MELVQPIQCSINELDYLHCIIEKMSDIELDQLVEVINEQRIINKLKDAKKVRFQQYLRDERLKIKNRLGKENIAKPVVQSGDFSSDEEIVKVKKNLKKKV